MGLYLHSLNLFLVSPSSSSEVRGQTPQHTSPAAAAAAAAALLFMQHLLLLPLQRLPQLLLQRLTSFSDI